MATSKKIDKNTLDKALLQDMKKINLEDYVEAKDLKKMSSTEKRQLKIDILNYDISGASIVKDTIVTKTFSGTGLSIRQSPTDTSKEVGTLKDVDDVTTLYKKGDWYYITAPYKGWIKSTDVTVVKDYTTEKKVSNLTSQISKLQKKAKNQKGSKKKKTNKTIQQKTATLNALLSDKQNKWDQTQLEIYTEYINSTYGNAGDILVDNMNGIYGIPYQFMDNVDMRVGGDNNDGVFGQKYVERIISKIPLLFVTPGKLKFMNNFSKFVK